jgi:hypothetical protein
VPGHRPITLAAAAKNESTATAESRQGQGHVAIKARVERSPCLLGLRFKVDEQTRSHLCPQHGRFSTGHRTSRVSLCVRSSDGWAGPRGPFQDMRSRSSTTGGPMEKLYLVLLGIAFLITAAWILFLLYGGYHLLRTIT